MENNSFTTNGKIWLEVNNVKVLGPGRVELLERIDITGSISQASLQMAMSNKKAWQIIKEINAHFAQPAVISHRGGKGGGNAELTENGRKIIADFNSLQHNFQIFLANNHITNEQLQA
jgi:molybdate transport system regulatory protein